MDVPVYDLNGVCVLELAGKDQQLRNDHDALDAIAAASAHSAELVVIPVPHLAEDFFRLKTRVAGEIIQKFVTYRVRLVILGDISNYLQDSSALQDFVYECNEGPHVWFVNDMDELRRRLLERL